jgi:hypothetical protein
LLRRSGTVSLRLLGGFEITSAGREVRLPRGRPATAVRAVAVAGGRLHSEALIELLWPGAAPSAGRSRLRNLLNRVRVAGGELLQRDCDVVRLVPGHEIDATHFDREARAAADAAAAGDEARATALARSAVTRYRGDLLPDDRYAEWTEPARGRLRARYLDLLDLLAAAAQRHADFDEAIRMIERALEVEPTTRRDTSGSPSCCALRGAPAPRLPRSTARAPRSRRSGSSRPTSWSRSSGASEIPGDLTGCVARRREGAGGARRDLTGRARRSAAGPVGVTDQPDAEDRVRRRGAADPRSRSSGRTTTRRRVDGVPSTAATSIPTAACTRRSEFQLNVVSGGASTAEIGWSS